jgi:hypothetical protein
LQYLKEDHLDIAGYSVDKFKDSLDGLSDVFRALNQELAPPFLSGDWVTSLDNLNVSNLLGKSNDEIREILRERSYLTEQEMSEFLLKFRQWENDLNTFSEETRENISDELVSLMDLPPELINIASDLISDSISDMSITTSEELENAGNIARDKALEIVNSLDNIDAPKIWESFKNILSGFDESIDFNNNIQAQDMLRDSVRRLGDQYNLSSDQIDFFASALIALRDQELATRQEIMDAPITDVLGDTDDFKGRVTALVSEVQLINEALSSQAEDGYLTADMYDQLIGLSQDYADVITNENGNMILNESATKKLISAKKEMLLGEIDLQRTLAEEQYSKNAAVIKELKSYYNDLTIAQMDQLNSLESQNAELSDSINNYSVLYSEVENAITAFDDFERALQTEDQGANYETLISALDVINDGLKTGKKNTDQYLTAIDLLFGDNVPDDLESALRELSDYINDGEYSIIDVIDRIKELDSSVVEFKENADGSISFDIKDLDEMAKQLGVSRDTVDALLGLIQEYTNVDFSNPKEESKELTDKQDDSVTKAEELKNKLNEISDTQISDLGFDNLTSDIQESISRLDVLISRIRTMPSVPTGFASGTPSAPGGPALTGEEGVEGRISDGEFSLIGKNGPEIKNLKRGDVIIPNKETEEIIKGSNVSEDNIPSYRDGAGFTIELPRRGSGSGGGSGGGSGNNNNSSGYVDELKREIDIQLDALDAEKELHEQRIEDIDDEIDEREDLIDKIREEAERQEELIDRKIEIHEEAIEKIDDEIDEREDLIDSIQEQADKEQEQIDNQIKSHEENIKNIDSQIDGQKQILENLRKQNEEENRNLELQKALDKLTNIRREKNVRMFNAETQSFEWTVDPRALAAQEEVVDQLQKDLDLYNQEQEIQSTIDSLENQKEAQQEIIEQLNEEKDKIQEIADLEKDRVQREIDILNKRKERREEIIEGLNDEKEAIQEAAEEEEKRIQKQIDRLNDRKEKQQEIIDGIEEEQDQLRELSSDIGLLDDEVRDNINSWDALIDALERAGIAIGDINDLVGGGGGSGGGSGNNQGGSKVSDISGVLKKGDRGNKVKTLQRGLSALGYNVGSIDGIFGDKTLAALKNFQQEMGVEQTGILNNATKRKFALKGYSEGGGVYQNAPAMLHGSPIRPEYVYSAPNVEKIMGSLPDVIARIGNSSDAIAFYGDISVSANNPYDFIQQMKNYMALNTRVSRKV